MVIVKDFPLSNSVISTKLLNQFFWDSLRCARPTVRDAVLNFASDELDVR